ncbi:MAG: Gfo/Idh/MocA family oxidoreductase [Ruminococcaceae bacterium]|nr:Gfo/Idh/MocA family oxidoreductase [Oscillospiraceae bacterium]
MLRFAVLGAGGIANQFANAVSLVEKAEIIAVASKSAERAAAFAERHSILNSYGSYAEMLRNPDVDAVYVATTHNFHKENIIDCLNAGKHVLSEKPMVLTEAGAKECFALAREKNLFLMEAMWSRCLPALRKAREWIAEGRIGEVRSANSVIGFNAGNNTAGRILNPDLAGGAIYDIGVYPIEIVSALMNAPVENILFSRRNHPVTGVDACVSLILSYPNADACIQCMVNGNPKEYTIVNGSKGFIEIPASHSVCEVRLHGENHALIEKFEAPYQNGFTFEIEEMIACIEAGKLTSDINPPEVTVECARIFDTVLGTK